MKKAAKANIWYPTLISRPNKSSATDSTTAKAAHESISIAIWMRP